MYFFITLFAVTFLVSQAPRWVVGQKPLLLSLLLSFSGAFLLGITLLHVFPELYHHADSHLHVGIMILIGFFVQVVLESYSKGIEHGHLHLHDFRRIPYPFFAALCVHALLEGTALTSPYSVKLGAAILIHKIPVAFLLGLLALTTNAKGWKGIVWLIVFSACTPLGTLFAGSLAGMEVFSMSLRTVLMAMATGSFLHVSTTILFETSPEHKIKIGKFLPALCGGILAVLISFIETH